MTRKARELPKLATAQPYQPPAPGRVRHDTVWLRALRRGGNGVRATVRFPRERR